MAGKDKNTGDAGQQDAAQAAALAAQVAAGVETPDVSSVVGEDETASVAEQFFNGAMPSGYSIRFVTRGGEAVPIVRKL